MNYQFNHFTFLWFKICSLISKKILFSNENAPSPRSIYLSSPSSAYAKQCTDQIGKKNELEILQEKMLLSLLLS